MSKYLDTLQHLIETATISYYVGRGVKCKMAGTGATENCGTSYYNPMYDEIVISPNNITNGLRSMLKEESEYDFKMNLEDDSYFDEVVKRVGGDKKLEELVRGILYHETSHVMHTPNTLYDIGYIGRKLASEKYFNNHKKDIIGKTFDKNYPIKDSNDFYFLISREVEFRDIVNIFEDQRIEEINKNYYLHVDFRKNLELMNPGYQESFKKDVKNVTQLFFECCRFQHARNTLCQRWIDKLNKLIFSHMDINCATEIVTEGEVGSDYDSVNGRLTPEGQEAIDLMTDVFMVAIQMLMKYKMFDSDNTEKFEVPSQDGDDGEAADAEDFNNDGQKKPMSEEDKQKARENGRSKGQVGISKQHEEYDIRTVKDTSEIYPLVDTLKRKLLEKFISSCVTKKGNMGYSGRFKPRYFIRPHMNNGKLFYRENPDGGVNGKGGKKRLNLWLDWSGSYSSNCEKTNKIIAILNQIEHDNKNFEFNLIAMGGDDEYETKLLEKGQRRSGCNGGTNLNGTEVERLYGLLHKDLTVKTIDILLFDGRIGRGLYSLAKFNKKTSYFIVDRSVSRQISGQESESSWYSPITIDQAFIQIVTCGRYPKELIKNVQKVINILL